MPTKAEFDWDHGNWPKCGRHGLSKTDVEDVVSTARFVVDDPSPIEKRLRTVGVTMAGRYAFVVFTLREVRQRFIIRPISARYMHAKEVRSYEEALARLDE